MSSINPRNQPKPPKCQYKLPVSIWHFVTLPWSQTGLGHLCQLHLIMLTPWHRCYNWMHPKQHDLGLNPNSCLLLHCANIVPDTGLAMDTSSPGSTLTIFTPITQPTASISTSISTHANQSSSWSEIMPYYAIYNGTSQFLDAPTTQTRTLI